MKLTDIFVRRPVLAIVVNLVILIAGLQSIRSLSVRQYPRSDIAVIRVNTAYIGASADLVRGFITTPLERVIASADGIDYLESSSAQSLSTIVVHLKLNYDTSAALTQIQAKVAQVRNDLPPEAQAPDHRARDRRQPVRGDVHRLRLRLPRPEPDHRLPDPRGAAQALGDLRACSAPTSSATAPSPCGSGSRPTRWRPWASAPRRCATPWGATTTSRPWARPRARWCRSTSSPTPTFATAEEFRQLVVKEEKGVVVRLGDIADVVLGAENYDADVRFNGADRHLHGHLGAARGQLARGHGPGPRGAAPDPGPAPGGDEGGGPLRLDPLHPGRDRRGPEDPQRDPPHRHRGDLPVPGLAPLRARSRWWRSPSPSWAPSS